MTLEIEHFQEKPPQFRAVEITLDNYEEIAQWIDAYSFTKTVVNDGTTSITFKSRRLVMERGQEDVVIWFETETGLNYREPTYMIQKVGERDFAVMTKSLILRQSFPIPEEVIYEDVV